MKHKGSNIKNTYLRYTGGETKEEKRMSIKKKLGLGVASAALGLSLIGGGTWAAFNDIKTTNATFAAGTLSLGVSPATDVFDIDELAPGDYMTRNFDIINQGSIEIKQVLMGISYVVKNAAGDTITGNDAEDFANQFKVNFLTNDGSPVRGGSLLGQGVPYDNKTLKQLKDSQTWDITNAFHGLGLLDPNDRKLAVSDSDTMRMKITFENKTEKDANGLYLQNKYQGWTIVPTLTLEAVQRDGMQR